MGNDTIKRRRRGTRVGQISVAWRKKYGFEARGGFVLITRAGYAQGWIAELTAPERFLAGTYAVDSYDVMWKAVSEDGSSRADRWELLESEVAA